MHKVAAQVILPFVALLTVAYGADAQSREPRLAITDVTVIDVDAGTRMPHQTVLVRDNRIERVGATRDLAIPAGARSIDGRGKYLIPGLWDMHVHIFSHNTRPGTDLHGYAFPEFLANGVTGVRDMWTDLHDHEIVRAWRDSAAAGQLLMPRVVPTSTVLDGSPPLWPTSLVVTSAERARQVVDSFADAGVRIIKALALPRVAYLAAAQAAKRRGLTIVGHVSREMHLEEASNAGFRSLEHFDDVPESCMATRRELDSLDAVFRARDTGSVRTRRQEADARAIERIQALMIDEFSDSVCSTLASVLRANHTWLVPTAVLRVRALLRFDPERLADPYLEYADARDVQNWRRQQENNAARMDSSTKAIRRRYAEHWIRLIGVLAHHGAPLMTGTDLGNPWVVPGFGLQEELRLFVRGGMSPLEALRAATLEPARYLAATDSLGTVARGKLADLVLLDADPLLDIGNAARIRAVVANGHYLDRPALDALLEQARRRATRP
jgi:hypothetical protein